jgi:S1-C subfamily serine protease
MYWQVYLHKTVISAEHMLIKVLQRAKELISVGEEVYTIGYPQPDIMGTEPKLTTGIINALSGIDNDNTHTQISVQIQPGNSGGPLFNSNGNVVQ